MRVDPLLAGWLGQELPLPLRPPPPVFAHLFGHHFVTFCENLKMTGWIFFELYRFLWRHFLSDFRSKVLNAWKLVKNQVFKQIANKIITKCIITCSTKLLSLIFKIWILNKIYFWKNNCKIWSFENLKNGYILEVLVGTIHIPNFKKTSLFFAFLKHYMTTKVWRHFLTCNFGSSRHRKRKLIKYLESWENSESETCALNAKKTKFDLIWPDMDLTSANSQAEWRHNVK